VVPSPPLEHRTCQPVALTRTGRTTRGPWARQTLGAGGRTTYARTVAEDAYGIDLLWLPMGVRGRWLRVAGRVYEAVAAALVGRDPCEIYHSVLLVRAPEGRFVIEMGPAVDERGGRRGVVARGAVMANWAARCRWFRYEIRCWREGTTAVNYAVGGPSRLTDDVDAARRVLEIVPTVPTPLRGRDELAAGEMWTCNSLTSWLIGMVNADMLAATPAGGRAPGWDAGLRVAGRR
jgi:hypothetical protein